VSSFSEQLIGRSGYLEEGFAELYDAHRPAPPAALLDILAFVAGVERPRLVVDLGAGTGLSTRVWADRAEQVVGIEPNPRMIERARAATDVDNVEYVEAFAAETTLGDGGADLVTCSQAFHWMEPGPVLAEAARILRHGGVFAAYDVDVPPVVQPEVDDAFARLFATRREARGRLGLSVGADTWPKDGHLLRIRDSGRFRFAREVVCHGWGATDAERLCGFAASVGGPERLLAAEAPEVGEAAAHLREVAERVLGARESPMLLCYRVRIGVR
jgi:SAM-dependent methyltransferase